MKPNDKKRWPPPPGVACWAKGQIQGIIHTHSALQTDFCRAEVEVGEQLFPVFAVGDLAAELSAIPAGTAARFEGIMRLHSWPVGRGQQRSLYCLDINDIIVLGRSPESCQPRM